MTTTTQHREETMKKHIALASAVLAAAAFAAPSAQAADYTMKIGFATFKDVQHQWADWMKEEVKKNTGEAIDSIVTSQ